MTTAPEPVTAPTIESDPGEWSWLDSLGAVSQHHDELTAEAQMLRLQLGAVETELDKHAAVMDKARELRALLRELRPAPPREEPAPAGDDPVDRADDSTSAPADEADPPDDDRGPGDVPPPPAPFRPRRRLAARIGRVVAAGVAAVFLAAMLLLSVGPRILPYQSLVVRSGSMSPRIPVGSMVLYHRAAATQIKVGDVIVFAKPGSPDEKVTHRVYRIGEGPNGRYFETKGDANGAPDAWRIAATGTGWVAFAHVPDVGYVLGYLQTGSARMLLIVVPALLLGGLTLVEIWRPRSGARRIAAA